MSMSEFSRKIFDYMNDNNISQREVYEYTKEIYGKIWNGFSRGRKAIKELWN